MKRQPLTSTTSYGICLSMPPLTNIKHELLAHNILAESGNATKAYQATYPDSSYETANANAYKMLLNGIGIRQRVFELMVNHGRLALKPTLEKLADHIESKDDRVSLTALQTAFKLYGATDTGINIDQSQHLTIASVNIVNMSPNEKLARLRELLR